MPTETQPTVDHDQPLEVPILSISGSVQPHIRMTTNGNTASAAQINYPSKKQKQQRSAHDEAYTKLDHPLIAKCYSRTNTNTNTNGVSSHNAAIFCPQQHPLSTTTSFAHPSSASTCYHHPAADYTSRKILSHGTGQATNILYHTTINYHHPCPLFPCPNTYNKISIRRSNGCRDRRCE